MPAQNKTVPTSADVLHFLANFDVEQRKDSEILVTLMQKVSDKPPVMWGPSIIGFGQYHYKSERSKQEGDWPLTGFSPRKQSLTLYLMLGFGNYAGLLAKLGKYKTGKGCLYINKLTNVDLDILEKLISQSYANMKKAYANQR